MTPARRAALNAHLHWGLALLALWLVLTSPWVSMFRRLPAGAGFFEYAHVVAGWLVLLAGAVYGVTLGQGGRWRAFYPWAAGAGGAVVRDLGGILRGQVPAADGPGLYSALKGLLLLALLATAVTGAGWSMVQGSDAAVVLRDLHQGAVKVLLVTGAAHVLAVASHLLDL